MSISEEIIEAIKMGKLEEYKKGKCERTINANISFLMAKGIINERMEFIK